MPEVTWVLESSVFPKTHELIRNAVRDRGHRMIEWSDTWWVDGIPSAIPNSQVVFHGSLGNAARIEEELHWTPGSFCPVQRFCCSAWYEEARRWLVHSDWIICPAREFVTSVAEIASKLLSNEKLFVRPDSPLKPFSGRVVETASLTLANLDYGFYYEDDTLPVVVAPVHTIGDEWRFVVANQRVISGSAYDSSRRTPIPAALNSTVGEFASMIATQIRPPADVYVLDICESNGQLRLLELNPFGGADLYACDPHAIIDIVTQIATATPP